MYHAYIIPKSSTALRVIVCVSVFFFCLEINHSPLHLPLFTSTRTEQRWGREYGRRRSWGQNKYSITQGVLIMKMVNKLERQNSTGILMVTVFPLYLGSESFKFHQLFEYFFPERLFIYLVFFWKKLVIKHFISYLLYQMILILLKGQSKHFMYSLSYSWMINSSPKYVCFLFKNATMKCFLTVCSVILYNHLYWISHRLIIVLYSI